MGLSEADLVNMAREAHQQRAASAMNGDLGIFNHNRDLTGRGHKKTKSGNRPLYFNNDDIGLTIEPAFDEPDDEENMDQQLMNINNRNKLGIPP